MGDDGGCALLANAVVDVGNAARRIVEMSTSLAKFLLVTQRMLFAHYHEVADRNDRFFRHADRAGAGREPKGSRWCPREMQVVPVDKDTDNSHPAVASPMHEAKCVLFGSSVGLE
jgi:hypothetical protein